jgi:hypothetical protein
MDFGTNEIQAIFDDMVDIGPFQHGLKTGNGGSFCKSS